MKVKENLKKIGTCVLAGSMAASGFMAVPVFAASSADAATNNTAVNDALDNADIIDYSRTGSITIYKYDSTSAQRDGVWSANDDGTVTVTSGGQSYTVESTGEANATAEEALADYAIQGVEFSYVHLGDVETYSFTGGGNTDINVVYEIDDGLAGILGLEEAEAYDMTAEGVAFPCENDRLHYDSSQLGDALADLMASGDTAAKNQLEAYAEANRTGTFADTDANGYTHLEGLPLGLYLIVETEVPEEVTVTVAPWLVSLPFTNISDSEQTAQDEDTNTIGETWLYDATCYPKDQTGNPTLDKMVRNAYGNILASGGLSSYGTNYVVSAFDDPVGADDAEALVNSRNTEEGTDEYKFGDTTTASEGDILDYIVVSKLPTITSNATFLTRYTFVDNLSAGLTYNKDARIAIYNNEADANLNNLENAVMAMDLDEVRTSLGNGDTTFEDGGNPTGAWLYSQNYVNFNVTGNSSGLSLGETTMTISFTEDGLRMINEGLAQSADVLDYGGYAYTDGEGNVVLNEDGFSDYYVVLYYTVTVNSDAQVVLGDDGNPNDVNLTWERTSEDYTNTLEDRCYVYAYGVDLTKYFSDNNGDFSNVQFLLYNETDGYYVVADTVDDSTDENIYYAGGAGDVAGTELGKTASRDNATVFVPNASGKIYVHGLEADTYKLIEIATDDGYKLLAEEITIQIDPTTREIRPSVVGYIGNDSIEGSHVHDADCYDESGMPVCGFAADEDANGRTIGKIAMYVGQSGEDFTGAAAAVDGVAAEMVNDRWVTDSADAAVVMEVTNTKTFAFPATGGYGTLLFTLAGCGAAFIGIVVATRKKKTAAEK